MVRFKDPLTQTFEDVVELGLRYGEVLVDDFRRHGSIESAADTVMAATAARAAVRPDTDFGYLETRLDETIKAAGLDGEPAEKRVRQAALYRLRALLLASVLDPEDLETLLTPWDWLTGRHEAAPLSGRSRLSD